MRSLKEQSSTFRAKKAPSVKKAAAKKAAVSRRERASAKAAFDPANDIEDFWEEVVAEHGPVLAALAK